MSSSRNRGKSEMRRFLKFVLLSIAIGALGYYLLDYVAPLEDPPLGTTFYIITGCILIAAALIILGITLKNKFFPAKKKKKGSRPVFLNDIQNKDKHS